MRIAPLSKEVAAQWLAKHGVAVRHEFNVAVGIRYGADSPDIAGVATASFDGEDFALVQIQTNTEAQVGTLLYGALWRIAKAMGYSQIWT